MPRRLIVPFVLTALLAACGEHAVPSAVNGPATVAGTRVAPVANPNRPGTTRSSQGVSCGTVERVYSPR
jgi:hypothetical protein